MNQIRITAAAIAILTVAFASQAFANGPSRSSSSHATSYRSSSYTSHTSYNTGRSYNNYHLTHGTRFDYGYFYRGRTHSHWTYTRFDARYGCTCYFDPCNSCWYYWCQPANCYYPVSYNPYRTYCYTGGCSSSVVIPVVPVTNVAPIGPVGPAVTPAPITAPVTAPQGDGPPPIPAPARN